VTAVLFTIGKALIGWYIGSTAVASTYGAAGALIVLLLPRFSCWGPNSPRSLQKAIPKKRNDCVLQWFATIHDDETSFPFSSSDLRARGGQSLRDVIDERIRDFFKRHTEGA
jgi:hypothetical protein